MPGTKKRRGCGRITKQSVSQGYSWPVHLTHYRINLSKYWCWKKGRIVRGSISAHGSFPYIDNFIDKRNQKKKGDYLPMEGRNPQIGALHVLRRLPQGVSQVHTGGLHRQPLPVRENLCSCR